MPGRKRVILDTSFLLIPAQFGVDIFSELDRVCGFAYTVHIVDGTVQELEGILAKQRGKHKEAAKLALGLLRAKNINTLPSAGEKVDDAIASLADKDTLVATQDAGLKRRVKGKAGGIITLRQKRYLILT
jgi:rRNA-processing protein FCF1